MPMKNPVHPGVSVKENYIEGYDLSVTEAARVLGVSRVTLSRLVNSRSGISPEMAIRLEKVGWSNADFWMRRQASYDLARARLHEDQITVEPHRRKS